MEKPPTRSKRIKIFASTRILHRCYHLKFNRINDFLLPNGMTLGIKSVMKWSALIDQTVLGNRSAKH